MEYIKLKTLYRIKALLVDLFIKSLGIGIYSWRYYSILFCAKRNRYSWNES